MQNWRTTVAGVAGVLMGLGMLLSAASGGGESASEGWGTLATGLGLLGLGGGLIVARDASEG